MVTNKEIKRVCYCRTCLNEAYHLHLDRQDVLIHNEQKVCRRCGKLKRIIYRVRPIMAWKLLLGHRS